MSEIAEALDRFERAAMAYERLGKMTRDDEKTRAMRREGIAELASARKALTAVTESGLTPADGVAIPYRPQTNAVVVTLQEFQSERGTERRLSYSIEVKDRQLEGDLRRLAAELMNQRGFTA